jgi:hypothetical protein
MNSCSAGAIPYLGAHLFFFSFGTVKVAKTELLLSGRWLRPSSLSLDEYKCPHLGGEIGL